MKVKLEAGASLDLLTKDEVSDALRSWHNELRAGCRYPMFAATGTVDAAGALVITGDQLGPAEGFVWDVRRIAISGGDWDASADSAAVFVNEQSPARLVINGLARYELFTPHSLVLNYGSQLVVAAVGLTAGQQMTVSGQAKEVPYMLGWSL